MAAGPHAFYCVVSMSHTHTTPHHTTPRHATPRHATPRHATPRHATPHHTPHTTPHRTAHQTTPLNTKAHHTTPHQHTTPHHQTLAGDKDVPLPAESLHARPEAFYEAASHGVLFAKLVLKVREDASTQASMST